MNSHEGKLQFFFFFFKPCPEVLDELNLSFASSPATMVTADFLLFGLTEHVPALWPVPSLQVFAGVLHSV